MSDQIQGSGLGLTLVKEIAEAHQGRVKVKSEKNGSVFTLTLPMAMEDEAAGAARG